jgi:putative ABC transport system permease protein
MNGLGLVTRYIRHRRLRSTLTAASMATAMFGLTLLLSTVGTLESGWGENVTPRVVVHSNTSLYTELPYPHLAKILRLPGVVSAVPYTWFGGEWKDARHFFVQFAVDPRTRPLVFPEYAVCAEQESAFARDRTGAVVGIDLARRFGLRPGDRLTVRGSHYPVDLQLTVRGVMTPRNPGDPSLVLYFQRDYMEELLGRPNTASSFLVRLASASAVGPVSRAVDSMFAGTGHETRTETERALQLQFISMVGNVRGMALLVGLIAAASVLLIAGNTMAMSVRERTGEIAILKALGFSPRRILGLVLTESALLAVPGGLLGIAAAAAVGPALKTAVQLDPVLRNYRVGLDVIAIGVGLTLLIGVGSGTIAAWTSSRLNVAAGLRKVG